MKDLKGVDNYKSFKINSLLVEGSCSIYLKNNNILVIGASLRIGRQRLITFSQLGANVILIARNQKRLEHSYAKLEKGNHFVFSLDITEYNKLEEIVRCSVEKVVRISGFVHSAGIELTLPLRNMQFSYYEEIFSINVISGFELAKIISKKKYINKEGTSFVLISSVFGVVSQLATVAYFSSRGGALISGVKSISLKLDLKK